MIVILVVIALIATPIIINIIEKSKKSAFEDSVYGVMEAAKLKYTENILDNKSEEKTYLIEDGLRELEYSGKVDGKGVLKIDKTGKIELAIFNDKWCIRKSKEESKLEVEEYKDKCIIPGIERDPVITLNGEASITLKSREVYEEQGVIAKTVEGKELEYTSAITLNDIVVESIDTNKTGTYKITYSTSSNGKTATITRIVTITDGIGPVITFEPEIVNVKSTEVTGASTTGTIYGIYDMSNIVCVDYVTALTYVSSYVWGATETGTGAGFSSAPESKYYDDYYTFGYPIDGHAMVDTYSWYLDHYDNVGSYQSPWLKRGYLGIFSVSVDSGMENEYNSFRVILL